jgi:hypothetical protein
MSRWVGACLRDPLPLGCARDEQVGWGLSQTACKNQQTRRNRGLRVVHGLSRWVGACLRHKARIGKQEGPVAFGLCKGRAGGSGPVSDTKQESTNKRDPLPLGCARDEQVGWGLSQTDSKNRQTRGTRRLGVVHGMSRWVGACLRQIARIDKQEGPVAFGLCTGWAGGSGPVSISSLSYWSWHMR